VSLAQIIATFQGDVAQCDSLIANAHQLDGVGAHLLPLIDRRQIVVAALLNLFVAWETFLESTIAELMMGGATISGSLPVKYVAPPTLEACRAMIMGTGRRYFDYGNHDHVRQIVNLYFRDGYPFEPHVSGIFSDLSDIRIMRNASAHITSTTQASLETLALRVLSRPSAAIDLYSFLTSVDPRSSSGDTVFLSYKTKLVVVAGLIAQG
jgi:hypothetical protein